MSSKRAVRSSGELWLSGPFNQASGSDGLLPMLRARGVGMYKSVGVVQSEPGSVPTRNMDHIDSDRAISEPILEYSEHGNKTTSLSLSPSSHPHEPSPVFSPGQAYPTSLSGSVISHEDWERLQDQSEAGNYREDPIDFVNEFSALRQQRHRIAEMRVQSRQGRNILKPQRSRFLALASMFLKFAMPFLATGNHPTPDSDLAQHLQTMENSLMELENAETVQELRDDNLIAAEWELEQHEEKLYEQLTGQDYISEMDEMDESGQIPLSELPLELEIPADPEMIPPCSNKQISRADLATRSRRQLLTQQRESLNGQLQNLEIQNRQLLEEAAIRESIGSTMDSYSQELLDKFPWNSGKIRKALAVLDRTIATLEDIIAVRAEALYPYDQFGGVETTGPLSPDLLNPDGFIDQDLEAGGELEWVSSFKLTKTPSFPTLRYWESIQWHRHPMLSFIAVWVLDRLRSSSVEVFYLAVTLGLYSIGAKESKPRLPSEQEWLEDLDKEEYDEAWQRGATTITFSIKTTSGSQLAAQMCSSRTDSDDEGGVRLSGDTFVVTLNKDQLQHEMMARAREMYQQESIVG